MGSRRAVLPMMKMNNKLEENTQGSGRNIISGTIPAFAWRD
jgi:hypothetical protein